MKFSLHLLLISITFISCDRKETDNLPIFEVKLNPSYVPYNIQHELRSPYLLIKSDSTIYLNKSGKYYSGKLTGEELTNFQDTLTSIGFFDLDRNLIEKFNLDQSDGFGLHGTLVIVIDRFSKKLKKIQFAQYLEYFDDKECLYEKSYCELIKTLSKFNEVISQFEFQNMNPYKGELALTFVASKKIGDKEILEWPLKEIKPQMDSIYSFKNEIIISSSAAFIDSTVVLYQPYRFKTDTFLVFTRPVF